MRASVASVVTGWDDGCRLEWGSRLQRRRRWWWVGWGGGGRGGRVRTMAASMACLRSSSTVCRVESFSSCVIFAAIIGTLMRRALSVNDALYLNESVSATSLLIGSLSRILYLPRQSESAYL